MAETTDLSRSEKGLEELLRQMNEYLSSHGLGANTFNVVTEKYLNLSPDQLSKLSAEECGEGAYLLSQYSEYIQREINKQTAILDWADHYINKLVYPKLNDYGDGFVKFEYKIACAIKENPLAKELSEIKVKASTHLTSLRELPYKIEKRADRLAALQVTRRKKYES